MITTNSRPGLQIRKHAQKPARNYSMRNPSGHGRYFPESRVFTGDSLEAILAQHPAISGTYHVEIRKEGSVGYDYNLGGDVVFEKGYGGAFTYIPHGDIAIIDCLVILEHYMYPLRGKTPPQRGTNWIESVSLTEYVNSIYAFEAQRTNSKTELLREKVTLKLEGQQ